MNRKYIIFVLVVALVVVAYLAFYQKKSSEIVIPPLDSSYLQTSVDGDLYAAKGRKLERLYVSDGAITREEVEVAPPVPEDGFYVFLGSHGPRLVSAQNYPVIEVFEASHVDGPSSIFKISLDEGVCEGCVALEDIMIKNGQLLYSTYTSDRQSPTFYDVIDLTKETFTDRQITEEEWKRLAGAEGL